VPYPMNSNIDMKIHGIQKAIHQWWISPSWISPNQNPNGFVFAETHGRWNASPFLVSKMFFLPGICHMNEHIHHFTMVKTMCEIKNHHFTHGKNMYSPFYHVIFTPSPHSVTVNCPRPTVTEWSSKYLALTYPNFSAKSPICWSQITKNCWSMVIVIVKKTL